MNYNVLKPLRPQQIPQAIRQTYAHYFGGRHSCHRTWAPMPVLHSFPSASFPHRCCFNYALRRPDWPIIAGNGWCRSSHPGHTQAPHRHRRQGRQGSPITTPPSLTYSLTRAMAVNPFLSPWLECPTGPVVQYGSVTKSCMSFGVLCQCCPLPSLGKRSVTCSCLWGAAGAGHLQRHPVVYLQRVQGRRGALLRHCAAGQGGRVCLLRFPHMPQHIITAT